MLRRGYIYLLAVLFLALFSNWAPAKATDSESVVLSVSVRERTPLDTYNDFDLSSINPNNVVAENKDMGGLVKGTNTTGANDPGLQVIMLELGAAALAFLFSYFMKRKRRSLAMLEHKMVNNIA